MKKMNNKGVTLIELIVSFAIVAVAIIYFFQTLYTVKKVYTSARKETQMFIDKDYALRIVDAYVEQNGFDASLDGICSIYNLRCNMVTLSPISNDLYKYDIKFINMKNRWGKENDIKTVTLYKYKSS